MSTSPLTKVILFLAIFCLETYWFHNVFPPMLFY